MAIAVPLSSITHSLGSSKAGKPLLIIHGFFGSKQNWNSLGKSLNARLNCPVALLDLRNHGESPWAPMVNSYEAMAADVRRFVVDRGLESYDLMGHSMGGRVAMTLALDKDSSSLQKMCVVDVAPVTYPNSISSTFGKYM